MVKINFLIMMVLMSLWVVHTGAEISVTDFRGKTLLFSKPPQRIVCLIESALSGFYMLGVQDKIVGISTNVYAESVFQEYAAMDDRIRDKKIPAPGNWDFVNLENVIALQPDLVVIWSHQQESIASIEGKGIPVFGVFIKSFEDVYREIAVFGKLTQTEQRADWLIEYSKEQIQRFSQKTADIPRSERTKIYFMWAQGELETSGKNSTVNELIELAGAVNICGHIPQEHLVINMENILTWNPDMMVMWYNAVKDPSDIIRLPMWQSVTAVKTKRVYEFPSVFFCDLWTLKFQYAVQLTAKWAYPDMFEQIDLEKEKQMMLEMLYDRRKN